ncbi:OmpA family protein [Aquicoccus sp. SCR17]|nr:OmpA family protein [Carideicomes alvinocaridis]
MVHWRAAVFAALLVSAALAGRAMAQDVTLTSRDGSIRLDGDLLGFDGEFYRVETIYGEMTVDASGVTCEGAGCPDLEAFVAVLRASGSAAMGDVLLPALIEGFAAREGLDARRETLSATEVVYHLFTRDTSDSPGREVGRFSIHATDTEEGFADLLADEADLVMATREIRPTEAERARAAGLGDMTGENRSRVLALDGLVPVVGLANPLREISLARLARVLAGEIENWQALGGPDAPITLHMRAPATGISQALQDRLMDPARLTLSRGGVQHPAGNDIAGAVADDLLGFGMASFSRMDTAMPLTLTGRCGFTLSASRRTIKTEDWPLTVPMFLYLPARRLPRLARDFLAYTRSPAAQIVIRRAGFVDQAPEEIAVEDQGDRLANAVMVAGEEWSLEELQTMIAALRPMKRLTLTFRFETASTRLDAQSRSNVQQLARALEAGQYDTRQLVFAGFSDGRGGAGVNRTIARRRAVAVMEAVRAAAETADFDRVEMSAVAYGEAMPMACDDTSWGRGVNRRVEVWLR